MFENENYFKIIAWLLGAGGVLFAIIGGLVTFIFREHVKDNNCQLSKNYHEHEKFDERMRDGGI